MSTPKRPIKQEDGVQRPMTDDEYAQYLADQAAVVQAEAERVAVQDARVALRASAEAKLAALGLTLDEITAIVA